MRSTFENLLNAVKENGGHVDFLESVEVHPVNSDLSLKVDGIKYDRKTDELKAYTFGVEVPLDELTAEDEVSLMDEIAWEQHG